MPAKSILTATALIFGLSSIGATAAAASETSQTPSIGTARAPVKPNDRQSRRVCRSEIPVGSRLAIRTCRTQAEIDEEATRTGVSIHEQQRDGFRENPKPAPL